MAASQESLYQKHDISFPVFPWTPKKLPGQSVNTGESKILSTGAWMWSTMRTPASSKKEDNSPKNLVILCQIGFNPAKHRTSEGMTTKKAQLRSILSQMFPERHFIKT